MESSEYFKTKRADYWLNHARLHVESQLSQKSYCSQAGLEHNSFKPWPSRYQRWLEYQESKKQVELVELEVTSLELQQSVREDLPLLTLTSHSGLKVEVSSRVHMDQLRLILKELR